MHESPVFLGNLILVLNPEPAVLWLHPCQRWNAMITWARRTTELVTAAQGLTEDGLLLRTERGRRWDATSKYEATDLGREVAARNAGVLLAGQTEERA